MEDLPFLRIMCLAACVNQKGYLASKAHYGDEIIKMANDQIYDTASFTVGLNAKIQCLFLSGGGNDIVEANRRKFLVVGKESDPGSFIDADKYDKLLKQVLQAYVHIIDMFTGNKKLHCKKVSTHTYDDALPDGRPFEAFDAFTVTGPWLKPYSPNTSARAWRWAEPWSS